MYYSVNIDAYPSICKAIKFIFNDMSHDTSKTEVEAIDECFDAILCELEVSELREAEAYLRKLSESDLLDLYYNEDQCDVFVVDRIFDIIFETVK